MVGRFLAGIGAVVWSVERQRYLILKRSADKDFGAGAWECVTGRVDQGESFSEALYREVREELGVTVVADFVIGTTHFYRGEARDANELLGVIYHCTLSEPTTIRTSTEHSAARWVTLGEAQALLHEAHPSEAWLLRILARATALRQQLPASVIALQRSGMEMQ